jgi:ectoine hydroxylase-related dioxygenase (phytanoyl-CoA dioxygenase family)
MKITAQRDPMSSAFRSTVLFGEAGYLLERSLLDSDGTSEVLEILLASKGRLHRLLEEWLGEPVSDNVSFANCQARIADYEARGLPKDLRHYLTGEFDLETRLNTKICALLAAPKVRATLARFLDTPKYYIHYPPMVRFKMADVPGSMLPPHQDFAYNAHLRDFVTVWVPLTDINDEVGGLVVHTGSHLAEKVDHSPSGPWAHGLKEHAAGVYAKRAIHMQVGDVLIFPPLLIHESAPHRSKTNLRYSIDFRVFRAPEDTTKSYFDPFENRVTRRH